MVVRLDGEPWNFLCAPGRVFSRSRLLDSGRKEGCDAGDRAIDTHVKNLRRKLNAVNGDGDYIFSVYGVDYRLARPSDSGS